MLIKCRVPFGKGSKSAPISRHQRPVMIVSLEHRELVPTMGGKRKSPPVCTSFYEYKSARARGFPAVRRATFTNDQFSSARNSDLVTEWLYTNAHVIMLFKEQGYWWWRHLRKKSISSFSLYKIDQIQLLNSWNRMRYMKISQLILIKIIILIKN